jgi:S1-C subfamily serine protease
MFSGAIARSAILEVMSGVLLLVLPLGMTANAQVASWLDSWREATVAIGKIENAKLRDPSGKEIEKRVFVVVGTGVIFGLPGQTSGVPWLVTAKHVFIDPLRKWNPETVQIRFAWDEQRPIDEYLGVQIRLKKGKAQLWISDTDSSVDLAAIPLLVQKSEVGRENVGAVSTTNFVSPADVFEGSRVAVFGYPGAVGSMYWSRALLRSGVIAWVHPTRPAEEPLLIDAAIYPGNSGGPVFREPTGMTRHGTFQIGGGLAFLGIVSAGRRQQTPLVAGGEPIHLEGPKGPMPLISESWMQIGVVEPASRVLRLLQQATRVSTSR